MTWTRARTRRVTAVAALLVFVGAAAVNQVAAATDDPEAGNPGESGGPGVLSDDCGDTRLPLHDGLPDTGRGCVTTEFGAVGEADENPSLLIVSAPEQVQVGEQFSIVVSTRNLVRDRFLPAAEGGFYAERSILDEENLVRGHFHTACRMLTNTVAAPDPEPAPEFFVATEDGGGGGEPDQVAVVVDGLPESGLAQCAVWAGDGSHRMPLMARPDQIPAVDIVRIPVVSG